MPFAKIESLTVSHQFFAFSNNNDTMDRFVKIYFEKAFLKFYRNIPHYFTHKTPTPQ